MEYFLVDHFVLNEAEVTLPRFLEDLENGEPRHLYQSDKWADISQSPIPQWNLIHMKNYASMYLQYSRGCPYDCSFCDITVLFGREPRTKSSHQVIQELESLYHTGWRSAVFFVDDNFIGNKVKIKTEILPAMILWMQKHHYPFVFSTESTINIADDEELMRLMVLAGFNTIFVGIESPNPDSLAECSKTTNRNRDLLLSIQKIQQFGLQIQGGFIVGFDNDPLTIFDSMISFIQNSGIATAMVGLLNAPVGTRLYENLKSQGRLRRLMSGDNTDCSMNFQPKMNYPVLLSGYRRILQSIYSPDLYYQRVKTFLQTYGYPQTEKFHVHIEEIKALLKSTFLLGIFGKERIQYWKLLSWSLFHKPKAFPHSITLAIYGFHFRKMMEQYLAKTNLDAGIDKFAS
jgi:radical SAM superfamily enzyme YgiQ (UPF0313 family)